jgi:hypothetical protein
MSSGAKVFVAGMRHVGSAKATHVTSAKAAHVAAAEAAAHVASAEAATTVSAAATATTTAAASLCARRKQAAGKHCACQNHHHSSSHDILHWDGRTFRHRARSDVGVSQQRPANVAMDWRWEVCLTVSTKFAFIWIECRVRAKQT